MTLDSLKFWKTKALAEKWTLWMQELEYFTQLPMFFQLFIKNKNCKDLLFQVLAGVPDDECAGGNKDKLTHWEKEQQNAVKFSYSILSQMFQVSGDDKVREMAIESGLVERILQRLESVSMFNV